MDLAPGVRSEVVLGMLCILSSVELPPGRLGIEYFLRCAKLQLKAERLLYSRLALLRNGRESLLAVTRYEFWLFRNGLPPELPPLAS